MSPFNTSTSKIFSYIFASWDLPDLGFPTTNAVGRMLTSAGRVEFVKNLSGSSATWLRSSSLSKYYILSLYMSGKSRTRGMALSVSGLRSP